MLQPSNVSIPGSVAFIGVQAFEDCNSLTSLTIPASVTNLQDNALADCAKLTSLYFEGDVPSSFGIELFGIGTVSGGFTIYYPATAKGWTTPYWNGYAAQPYLPLISLTRESDSVIPSLNGLGLGANYQLQVSTALNNWTNAGAAFTATNSRQTYPSSFAVTNSNQLFFRLSATP